MGVALEAVTLDGPEDALHLALVVDVLGEDVLVDRVAGRAVDEEVRPLAVVAARADRYSQRSSACSPARPGGRRSSWSRVQKMARSAAGDQPLGS